MLITIYPGFQRLCVFFEKCLRLRLVSKLIVYFLKATQHTLLHSKDSTGKIQLFLIHCTIFLCRGVTSLDDGAIWTMAPGAKANWAPPYWNLRSVGSKRAVLKKVLGNIVGIFRLLPHSFGARGIVSPLPHSVRPWSCDMLFVIILHHQCLGSNVSWRCWFQEVHISFGRSVSELVP